MQRFLIIIEKNGVVRMMNLQFFAESDIRRQESASLKRAIRNYEKPEAEQIKAICLQQADAWHTMKCWIF